MTKIYMSVNNNIAIKHLRNIATDDADLDRYETSLLHGSTSQYVNFIGDVKKTVSDIIDDTSATYASLYSTIDIVLKQSEISAEDRVNVCKVLTFIIDNERMRKTHRQDKIWFCVFSAFTILASGVIVADIIKKRVDNRPWWEKLFY